VYSIKFYLSSYKLGNGIKELKRMLPKNKRTAYIPNALDFSADLERRKKSEQSDIDQLNSVGLEVETLDLRKYFGRQMALRSKLAGFGVIGVRGGNTVVLRQAMKLSGFDKELKLLMNKDNVLYGGYSAGVCVLAPSLHGIELMDDKTQKPYGKKSKLIYGGLAILNYYVVPHYKSDHPETELAAKAVQYFIDNKLLFKALRDGEVIIF